MLYSFEPMGCHFPGDGGGKYRPIIDEVIAGYLSWIQWEIRMKGREGDGMKEEEREKERDNNKKRPKVKRAEP